MILSLRSNFNTYLISYLASMKLLIVFIIICRLTHQNNNYFIFLFMAMYLYLIGAKVVAIILLNYLSLSILYKLLLRKLENIKAYNIVFIK